MVWTRRRDGLLARRGPLLLHGAVLACAGALALAAAAEPSPAARSGPAPATEPAPSVAAIDSVRALLARGQVEPARAASDAAVRAWQAELAGDPLALAARLTALADVTSGRGQYAAAIELDRHALELQTAALGAQHLEVAATHVALASCYFGLEDLASALQHQQQAVAIQRALLAQDDARLGESLVSLGYLHYGLRRFREAAVAWEQALAVLQAAPESDHKRIVWCQSDLAEMKRVLGHYDTAESLQIAAIDRSRAHLPQDAFHATLLNNLGALYWDQDRFDDTERLWAAALRLSEADPLAEPSRIATAHLNLGTLFRDQGKLTEAQVHMTQALELARAAIGAKDARFVIFLLEKGKLDAEQDRWDPAIAAWEEGLQVLGSLGVPQEIYETYVLQQLARGYAHRGDLPRAEQSLQRAVDTLQRTLGPRHPDVGVALAIWAQLRSQFAASDDPITLNIASRAVDILAGLSTAPESLAEAYAVMARCEWAQAGRAAACSDMERALALVERLRPHRGGNDLSRARFLERFHAYANDLIAWRVETGDLQQALATSERARARVLRDQLLAGGVDLRGEISPEVLAPLERRERDARGRLRRAQQSLTWQKTSWARGDGQGLASLAELEQEVAAAAATLDAVGQEIKLHSPAWSRLLQEQSEPFALAQAQAELLRPNEQLIVYQIGPRASFVFLVAPQPGALQCFPLTVDAEAAAALGVPAGPLTDAGLRGLLSASAAPGDASSVAGLLLAFRGVGTLAPSSSAGSAPAPPSPAGGALDLEVRLYQLWRTLLPASAWTAMRRCHSVLVVPDGALHLLPFESLVVAAPGHGSPPRYWIDVGPVVRYAHSIATAVEFERRALAAAGRRERTSRAEGIVSVSDPAFAPEQTVGGAPIRRLPGTRAESAALAQAFHGATVQLLQGEFATERALRAAAPGARILHLATHGIVDEEQNPPFAALLLTPPPPGSLPASSGSTEGQSRSGRATGPGRAGHARGPDRGGDDASNDGVLRLSEVYDLNLDCDLAVLSACDTKLGKQVQGEGVFALSRAFQAAGARRTVASLWAVADESTALLMREYFQRIARAQARGGELDYARLLRDAKRRLRDDPRWSQPIFWAPFVLSGAR